MMEEQFHVKDLDKSGGYRIRWEMRWSENPKWRRGVIVIDREAREIMNLVAPVRLFVCPCYHG